MTSILDIKIAAKYLVAATKKPDNREMFVSALERLSKTLDDFSEDVVDVDEVV